MGSRKCIGTIYRRQNSGSSKTGKSMTEHCPATKTPRDVGGNYRNILLNVNGNKREKSSKTKNPRRRTENDTVSA